MARNTSFFKRRITITTKKGMAIKTKAKQMRVMGRATQGVKIINLKTNDSVGDVAKLEESKEIEKAIEETEE